MVPIRLTALTLALAAGPAAAQDFLTSPGNARVYAIDEATFEVVVPSYKGIGPFWCGAANYARRVLGASWDAPISISRTLGPSEATDRRSAVQFTLEAEALGIPTIRSPSPGAFPVGDTLSVQEANVDCDEHFFSLL